MAYIGITTQKLKESFGSALLSHVKSLIKNIVEVQEIDKKKTGIQNFKIQ